MPTPQPGQRQTNGTRRLPNSSVVTPAPHRARRVDRAKPPCRSSLTAEPAIRRVIRALTLTTTGNPSIKHATHGSANATAETAPSLHSDGQGHRGWPAALPAVMGGVFEVVRESGFNASIRSAPPPEVIRNTSAGGFSPSDHSGRGLPRFAPSPQSSDSAAFHIAVTCPHLLPGSDFRSNAGRVLRILTAYLTVKLLDGTGFLRDARGVPSWLIRGVRVRGCEPEGRRGSSPHECCAYPTLLGHDPLSRPVDATVLLRTPRRSGFGMVDGAAELFRRFYGGSVVRRQLSPLRIPSRSQSA